MLWGKFMGLMGRASLPAGAGLWLPDSNGIHMMFMRFPIDAVFVGRPAARRGRRAAGAVRASRVCGRGPGSCRWSAARTGCWSCRSARSSARARGRGPDPNRVTRPPVEPRVSTRPHAPGHGATPGVIDLARRVAALVLDVALPAACVGCGREGPPLCPVCLPTLDARLDALPARRSAYRPTFRPHCCNWTGAPHSRGPSDPRCMPSSTAASSGLRRPSARPSHDAGRGSALAPTLSRTSQSTPAGPLAGLRPGRAHRPGRRAAAPPAVRAAAHPRAGDDRPVRPRSAPTAAQTSRGHSRCVVAPRPGGAGRRRSLGAARRRRRDDGRHAGRLRGRPRRRRAGPCRRSPLPGSDDGVCMRASRSTATGVASGGWLYSTPDAPAPARPPPGGEACGRSSRARTSTSPPPFAGTRRKLGRIERLLDDRSEATVELSVEQHRERRGLAHRRGDPRHRRADAAWPRGGDQPRSRRSTKSSTRSNASAVDFKRKPRIRARPVEEKADPPADRRRDAGADARPAHRQGRSGSRSSRCSRKMRLARMDELGHEFFVFVNAETERIGVLYRRDDGDSA